MPKAIIFDFFDVLVLQGSDSFRLTYFPDNLEKNRQVRQLQADRELGTIDFDRFVSKLAAVGEVDQRKVLRYIENYEPNKQLLKYILDKLKPKYKIGIMPNTGEDWPSRILGSTDIAMFDGIILSKMEGFESGIYRLAARNLGVKENECVYIGYLPSFCQAAEAAGMKSIWYWGFKQVEKEFGVH